MSQETKSNKIKQNNQAETYLKTIFANINTDIHGEMEIRHIKNGPVNCFFYNTIEETLENVLDNRDFTNIYVGVNPRVGGEGKKENVHHVTTFHLDLDYGQNGHKKKSFYENYDQALKAIKDCTLQPTIVVHSGGGFHAYWVLNKPVNIKEFGIKRIEAINLGLIDLFNGDKGTQDISRILRVPGSYNMKTADADGNYRRCTIVNISNNYYNFNDIEDLIQTITPPTTKETNAPKETKNITKKAEETKDISHSQNINYSDITIDIDTLNISQQLKPMITNGWDSSSEFASRSEFDLAVILALRSNAINDETIKKIYLTYPVGEKYREHSNPDAYLLATIERAIEYLGLTDEQMNDPLFISGSVKTVKNKLLIDVINFQEYICQNHNMIYSIFDERFYCFDGSYYRSISKEEINLICQTKLKAYRKLFKPAQFKEFIHFAVGYKQKNVDDFQIDQKRYLTFENCNFNIEDGNTYPHSPDIFTTRKIPYNYDAKADCPRWKQFLEEIFYNDTDKIKFIQEIVGYIFYPAIPTPALFFLIGEGNNGKTVFLNIITKLIGEFNTSSMTLHQLTDDKFLPDLENKLANISTETPNKRLIGSSAIKSITSGDSIAGRRLYKEVQKYRFIAKHFLAMNSFPEIMDNTLGMKRRIYTIEFSRSFSKDEVDVYLEDTLTNELSGILNWALDGLEMIKNNNFHFSQSSEMLQKKDDYLSNSNTVISFMKRSFPKCPDSETSFKIIFDKYVNECRFIGCKDIQSKNNFKEQLLNAGYIIENSTTLGNALCVKNVIES